MKINKTALFFIVFLLLMVLATTFLSMFVGPILLGFLVSYLMNPVFVYFEKRGVSRTLSAAVSVISIILIVSIIVWIVLPIVLTQIRTIIIHIPDFKLYVDQNLQPKIQAFLSQFTAHETRDTSSVTPTAFNFDNISHALLSGIGESTKFLISSVLFIIATPLFMYIFMTRLPKFYSFIYTLIPASSRNTTVSFFHEVDQKLRAVLHGQVLVVLILSCIYPIAFLIAGMPTAIAIGVLVGVARLISGLDTIVAVTLGSIVLTVNNSDLRTVISCIVAYIIVQCLDAFVINPRVMGRFAGLHPVLILVSIISFGVWFGVYGVLLAIPIVTILKVAFQKMILVYKTTEFFQK